MKRLLKEMLILALGALALLYLLNPTAGFLELIPDNIPLIGNLDEAGATLILLNVLRYYGLDLERLFGKRNPPLDERQIPRSPDTVPALLDSNGNLVALDDDAIPSTTDSFIGGARLRHNGTYLVVVTRYAQLIGATEGDFELSVTGS